MADGWIVADTIGARSALEELTAVLRSLGRSLPSSAFAATAPSSTSASGRTTFSSAVEPGLAGVDLEALRRLVDAATAALLELEVLDDVGQVCVRARDAGRLEPAIELASCGPHERMPLEVLAVAGLLAHEHQPRARRPLTEHGLRGRLPQVTAAAVRRGLAQRLVAAALRQERGGVVRLCDGITLASPP